MNAFITDTDFLPDVLDIQYDEYQLLYGVIVNNKEGEIYDSIISLCRRHREDTLRTAKVDYWIRSVSNVISCLENMNREHSEVYVPYIHLRCSLTRLINLYVFAKDVLTNVRNLPMKELVRRDRKEAHEITDFYPIKYIDTLMHNAIPHLVSIYGETYKGVELKEIVEEELQRRGISNNGIVSSISPKNLYYELFLNKESSHKVEKKNYSREEDKAGRKEDVHLTRSIGLIYYVLQSLIKSAKSTTNKDKLQKLLNTTSATLSLCLFEPEREVRFEKSNWGGESKYQCVLKKKFLLNEANKKYIRDVLTTYKCEIPDELREKE